MASIRSAAASRTCSQLSNTNNRSLPSNAAATDSLHALAGLLGDAQHRRHRVGHRRGIGDRRQFEKPDAVGELIGEPACYLHREAGLADPAHPGQRDQPMGLRSAAATSATSASRPMKLVTAGASSRESDQACPQRRKVRSQTGRSDLKHPHRGREVAQPARSQIDEINTAEQTGRRLGHQDLTAVPGSHHPRRAVEHRPEIVSFAQLGLTGRNPIRTGNCNSRCASIAAFTADIGDANAAATPSPVWLNKNPSYASIAVRNTLSCATRADRIPSASASHRRVEPSTSVNKNVTTPEGATAAAADTSSESHSRHAATSQIGGI